MSSINTFFTIFFFTSIYCPPSPVSLCVYMWRPENNLKELVLSFYHVGPGIKLLKAPKGSYADHRTTANRHGISCIQS